MSSCCYLCSVITNRPLIWVNFFHSGENSPADKKSPARGQCTDDDEEDDSTETKANKQNGEHEDG